MPRISPPPAVLDLLARQDGVVSRSQALAEGFRPHDVARLVRRREWVVHQPGIYLDHTGTPTWRQRAWAAVLGHWPAALHGVSVLRAVDGAAAGDETIHVAIDRGRGRPRAVPGVRLHFVAALTEQVQWNLSPPRVRYEEAVLDAAAGARDDLAAVAVLSAACAGRHTTAEKLLGALRKRRRITRRRWMAAVLTDVAEGTHSVLEHGYRALERAHGLPRSRLQERERTAAGVVYRDASYAGRAVVELDGRANHSSPAQREADLGRDLEHAADGGATVRLGYRQVYGDGCATIAAVVRFLRSRGVDVRPRPCGRGCAVAEVVAA